jgi:hypothetical protein
LVDQQRLCVLDLSQHRHQLDVLAVCLLHEQTGVGL